ncbi:MAG TPA: F0F1 ATP synthase subunit gamma [Galbitalea sp.]|jgi:F-type H+-transporting ATPase subunit gamma
MGAQLREYRQRIRAAQTTKKITRAMELISASRIAKAQARVAASGPYSRAVTRAVSAVATYSNVSHILTTEPDKVTRAAVVLFTSDRGLNGAFSTNIVRESGELVARLTGEGKEIVYYVVGRKGAAYFAFRQRPIEQLWTGGTDQPVFATAQEIGNVLVEKFIQDESEGGVNEIHIVYNRFKNVVTQIPEIVRLLPLEVVEGTEPPAAGETFPAYEFEPDANSVLDTLLPVYIESRIFNAMLQSAASEHAARQRAMHSASDNADKLITDYTRLANNARQSEITQQISEIVGGADALSAR